MNYNKKIKSLRSARPLEMIAWKDSCSHTGTWNDGDKVENMEPSDCLSVGFIMRETDEHIVIASHLGPDWECESIGQVSGDICIPKSVIVHRRKL